MIVDKQNITQWDVLMKLEETQESITHMNKFCLDMICLYDSLKHSITDSTDGKEDCKDLHMHDKLNKETECYVNTINETLKSLKECKKNSAFVKSALIL